MKSILLSTAAVSNGGAFLDAGTTVVIGDEDDQISDARASVLTAGCLAVEIKADADAAPGTKTRK